MTAALYELCAHLHNEGTPYVCVTLIATRGEAPSDLGAKAVITAQGLKAGTVGGGKVEARAIQHALNLLIETTGIGVTLDTKTWNLQTDIGMTCGGEVTLLFEVNRPSAWEVVVFGAGHVGQALVRLLLTLECRVHCYDARQEWVTKLPAHPRLTAQVMEAPETVLARIKPGAHFVVMTQGHATDVPVLRQIFTLHRTTPFVGAIGSELKARRLRAELVAAGVEPDWAENLHCPVGLKIGNNSPAEIAVSVTAQLLEVRDRNASR